jgi:hypothetical protein
MTEPMVSTAISGGTQTGIIGATAVTAGQIIFGGQQRPVADHVLDFNNLIEAATVGFIGRDELIGDLDVFRSNAASGYFEIVADAGLGKTALAAQIVKRLHAPCFFTDASRGLTLCRQFLSHVCAAIITRYKLDYEFLPARAGEDATFLDRVLTEAAAKSRPIWVVVDGLDEAEAASALANPLLLPPHLPNGVYFVVTHRPTGGRFLTQPDTMRVLHQIVGNAPDQLAAIEKYLKRRIPKGGKIERLLSSQSPALSRDELITRLKNASQGNFMYLRYVLADMLAPRDAGRPLDLDRLPQGLEGYYEKFWSAIEQAKSEGWADWNSLYRPIMERLAVAAEAVTPDWIGAQIGRDPQEVRERALWRWRRLLAEEQIGEAETWRVIHRSFADFLETKVNLRAAHRAVAEHYTDMLDDKADWDNYGLRYVPMHLAAAAADSKTRHLLTDKLLGLVLDPNYEQEYLHRLSAPDLFEQTLELALRSASGGAAGSELQQAKLALQLIAFRKEQHRAQPIFDLGGRGEIDAAERRLELFALEVDAAWYQALLLIIAWLGTARSPEKAKQLRDRVRMRVGSTSSATLARLLEWVGATIDNSTPPAPALPSSPPRPEEARVIVARLTAAAIDRSLLAGADVELMMRREFITGSKGYLAERDAPDLVALAATDPRSGEALLQEYVAAHAAYGYREYRQGSLWALLDAVLRHPEPAWVMRWVSALGAAVLAPNRGEFRESLGLTTLALRSLAGDTEARALLDDRRKQAVQAVSEMPVTGAGHRGQGDTWGTHRRRLGALAEAFSILPGGKATSMALIQAALRLQFGFAGFNAPACLTLGEAIEVSSPDVQHIDQALSLALRSAHNIQDSTFCARTTSRVAALISRCWGSPPITEFDVAGASERLSKDASAAEFAALHVIGEQYAYRVPEMTIPLPHTLLSASTMADLAMIYQRPIEEFQRLNSASDWKAGQSLPTGTPVNVPDPGFAPLLAARFAARALADSALSDAQRQATIRLLVPVATADATALDAVLARWLLASRPKDDALLSDLSELANRNEGAMLPDSELLGRLTAFVP